MEAPFADILARLEPHPDRDPPTLANLGENDFIYKFRPEKERNTAILRPGRRGRRPSTSPASARPLRRLPGATSARRRPPSSWTLAPCTTWYPAILGSASVSKTPSSAPTRPLTENPGKRVFMLSELIHNPFVNGDLIRRGLRYLQTDKGVPHPTGPGGPDLWDTLTPDDIVIIPAFGATDEDKRRLVRKGIAVRQYDATCMLVEKVWKASSGSTGAEGYTVVIHGKHEHGRTKGRVLRALAAMPRPIIVRNMDETSQLGQIILGERPRIWPPRFQRDLPPEEVHRGLRRRARPGEGRRGEPDHAPHERDTRDHLVPQGRLCREVRQGRARLALARRGPGPQRHPVLRDPGEPGRPHPRPRRAAGRGLRHRGQEFLPTPTSSTASASSA